MGRALLIVDPQNDFIDGALPVPGARSAMDQLASCIAGGAYQLNIVTCDFHPWEHCSFVDNGGQWPRHCVAHSAGAAIWTNLLEPLNETGAPVHILRKGCHKDREEYSIFQEESGAIALAGLLKGVESVDICGLAGDVCVLNTLRDGIARYGNSFFRVLLDFSPSLDGGLLLSSFCAKEAVCAR